MNLLCRARPADEEHDTEHLAALLHTEDLRHPGADPLQMLRALDGPDKDNLARGRHAVAVGNDQVADVGHRLGDANTAGKEHDGAVRVHLVHASVGALDEAPRHHPAVDALGSLFIQVASHARAATDDERDGGLPHGENVAAVHGKLFADGGIGLFTPRDRERVRLPEADGWQVEIGVLAGLEEPGARHGHGDARGTTRESLNQSLAAAGSKVVVCHAKEASSAVKGPQDHDGVEVLDLREAFRSEVVVQADDGGNGQGDVQNLENLVEGVSENAGGLDGDGDKRGSCLEGTLATEVHTLNTKTRWIHTTKP